MSPCLYTCLYTCRTIYPCTRLCTHLCTLVYTHVGTQILAGTSGRAGWQRCGIDMCINMCICMRLHPGLSWANIFLSIDVKLKLCMGHGYGHVYSPMFAYVPRCKCVDLCMCICMDKYTDMSVGIHMDECKRVLWTCVSVHVCGHLCSDLFR